MSKYNIGDRVWWTEGGMKLTIVRFNHRTCRWSCICKDGEYYTSFKSEELKPIITCK